jgi:hypothetical protein
MSHFERLKTIEPEAMVFDDLEDAIIGIAQSSHGFIAVYSYKKMCDILEKRDCMDIEDVTEYIDYNIVRCLPYMGILAPVIMDDLDVDLTWE